MPYLWLLPDACLTISHAAALPGLRVRIRVLGCSGCSHMGPAPGCDHRRHRPARPAVVGQPDLHGSRGQGRGGIWHGGRGQGGAGQSTATASVMLQPLPRCSLCHATASAMLQPLPCGSRRGKIEETPQGHALRRPAWWVKREQAVAHL